MITRPHQKKEFCAVAACPTPLKRGLRLVLKRWDFFLCRHVFRSTTHSVLIAIGTHSMPPVDHGPLADYLKTVIEALPHPVPSYCLIGALAVTAWGQVRTTQDIDLLVLSQEPARTELIEALVGHGFQPDAAWIERNPLAKDIVLRLTHSSYPGLPLDLLFAVDAHSQSTLNRRQLLNLLGIALWVCSPEDLIMLKLKASRPHDFEDVVSVIKNPHLQLDLTYLWSWADRLGLRGELQYVLQAAGG
jgi:hypothetical protein